MSRQIINSDKFPSKPHNNPAIRIPGLVFCAGQTATGEIKQATVRSSSVHDANQSNTNSALSSRT